LTKSIATPAEQLCCLPSLATHRAGVGKTTGDVDKLQVALVTERAIIADIARAIIITICLIGVGNAGAIIVCIGDSISVAINQSVVKTTRKSEQGGALTAR
jgi:hypothetical protein